jgi:hypothetical protein
VVGRRRWRRREESCLASLADGRASPVSADVDKRWEIGPAAARQAALVVAQAAAAG